MLYLPLLACDSAVDVQPEPAPLAVEQGTPTAPAVARVPVSIPLFEEGDLVVELRSDSHFGPAHGWRVFADGRYETIAEAHGEQAKHEALAYAEPEWTALRTLDEAELNALYDLMYSYDLASLQAEYAPEQQVMDGTTSHWTLRLAGGPKEVDVEDGITVPALEAIWSALPPAVVLGESTATITLRLGEAEQKVELPCSPGDPEVLAAFTWALATDGLERAEGEPAAEAVRLIEIVYLEDGAYNSSQELWSDGWQILRDPGGASRKLHSPEQVTAMRDQLVAIDWPALPQGCPPSE
jgi:hypothetical protein